MVAVATTAKAVAELAGAGLDARTIARLRIDLANGPLAAGTVVVLDEISQTPTAGGRGGPGRGRRLPGREVCGSWATPASPSRSAPGGMADHIEQLATAGRIPSARLTVNRRQVDPADRQALDLLRRGEVGPIAGVARRAGLGARARQPERVPAEAMAAAVCEDIDPLRGGGGGGAGGVAHRRRGPGRSRSGPASPRPARSDGPSMTGPGWTTERDYQAGDRVLLHARCGAVGQPRWSTARPPPSPGSTRPGLTVRVDRQRRGGGVAGQLRAGDPQGRLPKPVACRGPAPSTAPRGAPGRPATCWASAALDAYRGYTGQSRSRQPTHTWNTKQLVAVDHGGILADQRDPAEVVAQALARQPDPTWPPEATPGPLDRQLRRPDSRTRAGARRPARRPPRGPGRGAQGAVARRRLGWPTWTPSPRTAPASSTAYGTLAGLSRRGRQERRDLQDKLTVDRQQAEDAKDRRDEIAARVAALQRDTGRLREIREGRRVAARRPPPTPRSARRPLGSGGRSVCPRR